MTFSVRIVDSLEALDALAASWNALAPCAAAAPMRQFAWMRSIAEALCEPGRLRVYVCERDGRVEAIAPLVLREGPRRLEVLGLRETGEPPDVPIGTAEGIAHLARALAGSALPFRHERLPADSPALTALHAAFATRGWVRLTDTDPTPVIELDGRWADPESQYGAKRRSDLRRMRKRAEKMGGLRFEIVAPQSEEELDAALAIAWKTEAAGWKGARGSALARNARLGRFYAAYARRARESGILRLAFMRIGGEVAAMQLVAECDRRWWLLKIGYDERFAACSPGTLLLMHTLGHAARRGLVGYEFLGNPDAWSAGWARSMRRSVDIRAYPWSLRSAPALGADLAASVRRRLRIGGKPCVLVPGGEEAVELLEIVRLLPV